MRETWLIVEKAINFFISSSFKSPQQLTINVNKLKNFKAIKVSDRQYLYCNKIYTPATTKVEEWTKEEIGVGALIAESSQALKGNCALFTALPKIRHNTPHFKNKAEAMLKLITPTKNKTKNKSPRRFWNKVKNPFVTLSKFL
jgi:hypothetical protein